MSKIGFLAKIKEENNNVVEFKRPDLLQPSGKDGGGDWLTPLPDGTVFLARDQSHQGYEIGEYHVLAHSEKDILLYISYGIKDVTLWVDPARFCNVTKLRSIQHYGEEEEHE